MVIYNYKARAEHRSPLHRSAVGGCVPNHKGGENMKKERYYILRESVGGNYSIYINERITEEEADQIQAVLYKMGFKCKQF